jgi:hypothetical protein
MTANTGVTHMKYLQFHLDDSGGTLQNLSAYVSAPGTFGLKYEEVSVVALADAIKSIVKGWPESPLSIQFIPHTSAFAHLTTLVTLNTPLAFDFRIGVLHAWEAGEPTYGLTGTSSNGIICTGFTFDGSLITATFNMAPGSAAPAWATVAHT